MSREYKRLKIVEKVGRKIREKQRMVAFVSHNDVNNCVTSIRSKRVIKYLVSYKFVISYLELKLVTKY